MGARFSPETYRRALSFAAKAHGDQKTPTGFPYLWHVSNVTMELLRALTAEPGHDEDLAVACALLHDVLEDTKATREQIEAEFGPRVGEGVQALTKDASLPKERRMADSLERILKQPKEIAMVKLADRISNLAPPPAHWGPEKIAGYQAEGRQIFDALKGKSAFLDARLQYRLGRYPLPDEA